MDISFLFLSFYIGVLLYLANQHEVERRLSAAAEAHPDGQKATLVRWMLFGAIGMKFVISLLIFQVAFLSPAGDVLKDFDLPVPSIDSNSALLNLGLMLIVCYLCLRVVLSEPTRQSLRRIIKSENLYDPNSLIHTTAVVLLLCFVSLVFDQLVASGGINGLAEQVGSTGISVFALVFQDVLLVLGAFLGIGMAIRRSLPQSLERLGLRIPTPQDVLWGIGAGLLLMIATMVMVQIWSMVVPAEQFNQQSAAADELTKLFNTLPLALLLSVLAGVSEEILFRGALQPIFGLGLANVFFALSHLQYSLTPATLIIFVVGLGLGWLRKRRNTSTAIIAHFVYDFVQLALAILIGQAAGGG